MSHFAYVNGRYVPHKRARVSIEDRGYQFADGVYEVICVWNGVPIDFAGHMQRLKRSLEALQMPVPSFAALTVAMKELVRRNRVAKGYIYLQVNRGVAPRAHPFPKAPKPTIVVTTKNGAGPSDALAEKGSKAVTDRDIRWERVDIKSVSLLPNVLSRQKATVAGGYETILLKDNGVVTEASSSNAWMVTPDQTIVTHPEGGILSGITRRTLIKLARGAGYRVEERPFTLEETKTAKEVFVSGTTTFVMPIVQIDERPVANGAAGTVALDLRQRYRAYVDSVDPRTAWNF
jgi:D-alanine transaminase